MFDAMKGLTEAISEKEKQCYPKRELTESRIEEINKQLSMLSVGDLIQVVYYCQYAQKYRHCKGAINRIDLFWKEIQVDDISISISEIYNLIPFEDIC